MYKMSFFCKVASVATMLICSNAKALMQLDNDKGTLIIYIDVGLTNYLPATILVVFPEINNTFDDTKVPTKSVRLTRISSCESTGCLSETKGTYRAIHNQDLSIPSGPDMGPDGKIDGVADVDIDGDGIADGPAGYIPPFVNHPDQWDVMTIKAASPRSKTFRIQALGIFYKWCADSTTTCDGRVISFIRTSDTIPNIPKSKATAWAKKYVEDDFRTPFANGEWRSNIITATSTGWTYDLSADIFRRRKAITEQVLNDVMGPGYNNYFEDFPDIVKTIANDYGQTGSIKLDRGLGYGCAENQAYYQCQDQYFREDFPLGNINSIAYITPDGVFLPSYEIPIGCPNNGDKYWVSRNFSPYPYSDGNSPYSTWPVLDGANYWGSIPSDTRDLGELIFGRTGINRTSLDGIAVVTQGNVPLPNGGDEGHKRWIDSGAEFAPKPGDMFWRNDNCWGWRGGSVLPPHAMTLVAPNGIITGINNDTSLPQIEAGIWDGDFYHFQEPYEALNDKIYANRFAKNDTADTTGDGCIEPWEWVKFYYTFMGTMPDAKYVQLVQFYEDEATYKRKICLYCDDIDNRSSAYSITNCLANTFYNNDLVQYCPMPTHNDLWHPLGIRYYYRRDYFVAETTSYNEGL